MKIFTIKRSAFTLIEVIVVVSVFAIIASLTIANYRSGSRQSQLHLAAQELATNIRLAQSYAIGSKDFVDPNSSNDSSQSPKGGWGILVSTSNDGQYQLVVDLNGNHVVDDDEVYKTIELPDNVVIKTIQDKDSSSIIEGTVFFEPPEPLTIVNEQPNNNLTITLYDQVEQTTCQVQVNFFGLVEVL